MYSIGNSCPGENIEVVRLAENEALLRQERRDNENRRWAYWAFHADDLPAREVTFRFEAEDVGPFGPAVSPDGVHWEWLGEKSSPDRKSFTYANRAGHKRVYFSIYLGYRPQNLDEFVERHPQLRTSTLTVSEKGREVPLWEIGRPEAERHILLTARHHSGETSGSYVLEGFLEHILKGRGLAAENFLFHVVPFVDYDGVAEGDPGNNRAPHNHNRDYIDEPRFAAVRAVKALADRYAFSAALDFHGPVKWGGLADVTHAVKIDLELEGADVYWAIMREKFGEGGIPIVHDLVFPDYNGDTLEAILVQNRRMNSGYMRFQKGVPLTIALETPFCGTPSTFTVTAEKQRELGRRYARGLDEYCRLFLPLPLCRWKNDRQMTYTGLVPPPLDFSTDLR